MNNKVNNVFFMEIFNEILKLNDNEIMIVYDTDGNIWFGLTDVIKALGYTDIFHAKDYINITKRNRIKYNKIRAWGQPQALNIQPNKIFINEAGLYELLSSSTKPLARILMDKYFSEIMPEIRKHGKYILDKNDQNKTDLINKELEQENLELKNNLRNIVYPKGNALYLITKILHHKKYYKIGFTKDLNKRLKVYNTSLPNKILYN